MSLTVVFYSGRIWDFVRGPASDVHTAAQHLTSHRGIAQVHGRQIPFRVCGRLEDREWYWAFQTATGGDWITQIHGFRNADTALKEGLAYIGATSHTMN